jgi:hypothetical protein
MMSEPTQKQQEILRALAAGVVFEHLLLEQVTFRRSDGQPVEEEDMRALRRAGQEEEKMGYITWPPFGEKHQPVRVELTEVGERWLREHSA